MSVECLALYNLRHIANDLPGPIFKLHQGDVGGELQLLAMEDSLHGGYMLPQIQAYDMHSTLVISNGLLLHKPQIGWLVHQP